MTIIRRSSLRRGVAGQLAEDGFVVAVHEWDTNTRICESAFVYSCKIRGWFAWGQVQPSARSRWSTRGRWVCGRRPRMGHEYANLRVRVRLFVDGVYGVKSSLRREVAGQLADDGFVRGGVAKENAECSVHKR